MSFARPSRTAFTLARCLSTPSAKPKSSFLEQFLRTNMAAKDIEQNRPIVISGPSGAGKSTILKRLFETYPSKFGFSISHTTRKPRVGEQDGREYHFTTVDEFKDMIGSNKFIEHAQFGDNHYGTSIAAVESIASQGRICILDIEMEGVKQIHKHPSMGSTARFLFLSPPDMETLEKRLRGRGTDAEEAVQKRLRQAVNEMEYSKTEGAHDKIVVNNDLDKAFEEVEDWILNG